VKIQELAVELNITTDDLQKTMDRMQIRPKQGSGRLDTYQISQLKRAVEQSRRPQSDDKGKHEPKNVLLKEKSIKVSNLIKLFGISVPEMMRVFLERGMLLNINSEVDQETAKDIALKFNITVEVEDTKSEEEIGLKTKVLEIEEESLGGAKNIVERAPVVTIMGHVDHGKTLLLDTIRKSNVISKEAGGITQHIGAYQVTVGKKKLTFLDTPGHEAFTSLRARGAQITDIVILVVAADEGVKPQTEEAIHHALAADVPIIVAINKMDKPDANPERVKQELSQHNLVAEDWGGKVIMVPISAKAGKGITELLEMVTLVSDMLELKANRDGFAKGIIIESNLSKQKGPIATVLVKGGTLKVGNFVVVAHIYGKVRAMFNDKGQAVKSAEPGAPAEILGLSEVPLPGVVLEVKATEKEARELAEKRRLADTAHRQASQQKAISLESLSSQAEGGVLRQLNLIIKSDVHGSLEAIRASIAKIDSQDIPIRILHAATGAITENDVMLARASQALIFGFGVNVTTEAQRLATDEEIDIKTYTIIYEIVDDIERVIQGLYKPVFQEFELGRAEVRQMFSFSKVGTIAGCYVLSGKITRNAQARVLRKNKEVHKSKIESLKRFKDDTKEVNTGFECGIVMDGYDGLEIGDIIQTFEVKEVKPI